MVQRCEPVFSLPQTAELFSRNALAMAPAVALESMVKTWKFPQKPGWAVEISTALSTPPAAGACGAAQPHSRLRVPTTNIL